MPLLDQVITYCLPCVNLLSEPMHVYCLLDPGTLGISAQIVWNYHKTLFYDIMMISATAACCHYDNIRMRSNWKYLPKMDNVFYGSSNAYSIQIYIVFFWWSLLFVVLCRCLECSMKYTIFFYVYWPKVGSFVSPLSSLNWKRIMYL